MEKQDIISSGLLELYAVGAASPEETAQVERWRDQYPEVSDELLRIEEAMEAYAMAHAVVPSEGLRKKILAGVSNNENKGAKIISISPLWRAVAAASIILLVCSAILNYIFYNKYEKSQQLYASSQKEISQQREQYAAVERDMNVVASKYSEPVSLHGMEVAPDAAAKIFWMKNTGDVYIDPTNLPAIPDSMQYQLWAIVDGKPVDAGMINSHAPKNYKIQKMKTFGKAQAFAVTLETKGGHPEPKGKMYVMGEI